MKIYTVMRMDQYNYDFSVGIQKIGAFRSVETARQCAAEEFKNMLNNYQLTENMYWSSECSEEEAAIVEEDPECGFYSVQFGYEEDHEYHCISVDKWELEDTEHKEK